MSGSYPRWRLCPPASPCRSLSKVRETFDKPPGLSKVQGVCQRFSPKFVGKKFVEGSLKVIGSSLSNLPKRGKVKKRSQTKLKGEFKGSQSAECRDPCVSGPLGFPNS